MDQAITSKDRVREAYVAELKNTLKDTNASRSNVVDGLCEKVAADLGVPVDWVRHVIQQPKEVA